MRALDLGVPCRAQSTFLAITLGAMVLLPASAVHGQPVDEPSGGRLRLVVSAGLTNLGADADPPGSNISIGVEHSISGRVSVAFHAGLATLQRPGLCEVGTLFEFPCDKTTLWPSVGVEGRAGALMIGSNGELYGVGQVGLHARSPVEDFYDLGVGASLWASEATRIDVEVRRRYGAEAGSIYSVRLARTIR